MVKSFISTEETFSKSTGVIHRGLCVKYILIRLVITSNDECIILTITLTMSEYSNIFNAKGRFLTRIHFPQLTSKPELSGRQLMEVIHLNFLNHTETLIASFTHSGCSVYNNICPKRSLFQNREIKILPKNMRPRAEE